MDQFLKGCKGKNLKIPENIFRDDKKFRNFDFFENSFFQKPFIFKFVAEKRAGFLDSWRCGSGFQILAVSYCGAPNNAAQPSRRHPCTVLYAAVF